MLKKSWYVPAAIARLNSFRLLINPSETMVLVMVVPTLAPMIIGMALSMVMEPEATKATTRLVAVELLCSMAAISNPINNPVNGLEVARRIASAAVFPRCCRDEIIKSSANTNSTSVPSMYRIFRIRSQYGG